MHPCFIGNEYSQQLVTAGIQCLALHIRHVPASCNTGLTLCAFTSSSMHAFKPRHVAKLDTDCRAGIYVPLISSLILDGIDAGDEPPFNFMVRSPVPQHCSLRAMPENASRLAGMSGPCAFTNLETGAWCGHAPCAMSTNDLSKVLPVFHQATPAVLW